MGRTVVAVLVVAAAVAVLFIPGVGPAISATLVSAGLSTATAAAITTAITTAVVSAGVASAGMLLGFGPSLPKPATTEGPLKTPIPRRLSAYGRTRLFGAYIYYESRGTGEAFDVFAIHDGQIDGIETRYLADDRVTKNSFGEIISASPSNDGRYLSDNVFWYETLGQTPGPGLPGISSRSPQWTANHRGDGVVLVGTYWHAPKQETFSQRFPQGGPVPASVVARWQRVFDWRDGTQSVSDPSTWKWSENALLHLAHYRLVREKARRFTDEAFPSGAALLDAWSLFFAPTLAYWTEAANVCDEAVPLAAGGTEPRYRSCFSHYHTDAHKDVINSLTSTFDGWVSPRADGALIVYAGKYYEPTVSIGPDEIVSYGWTVGSDDESSINEIAVTYVSAAHDYTAVDTTSWRDYDDMAARGAVRSTTLENAVPSHGQARRLAKRLMSRVMAQSRGTVTTNVAGRPVRGQRFINLRIEEAGAVFFDGVAEIQQMTRNVQTGGITFAWVAADPNVDAWNPATEEGDPAGTAPRIAISSLPAPEITSAFVVYTGVTNEGTGGRVQIDVTAPIDAGDADRLVWFARWRVQGATIWNEQQYNDTDPSPSVSLLTSFVPVGDDIEVEAAYRTPDGRLSPYSGPPTLVGTDTETVVPDAAVSVSLVQWAATLDLTTPYIPRASSYRWRFYAADGVTLLDTVTTTARTVSYAKERAAVAGARRAYVVDVAGVNAAGAGGTAVSGLLTLPAPPAVTALSIPDDATTAMASFTLGSGNVVGHVLYYSPTADFDPFTTGAAVYGFGSPIYGFGLTAGAYFGKVAAFDAWSDRPDLLNFTAEDAFTITTGGGGFGGGAAPGGGGGYCVTVDTPVLLADGTQKPAGDLVVGDMLRTQHEHTMEWGDYPVEVIEFVESSDLWRAYGIVATGGHRVWQTNWVEMRDVGQRVPGSAMVARITVTDAHTYYARGVLSHNIKPYPPEGEV